MSKPSAARFAVLVAAAGVLAACTTERPPGPGAAPGSPPCTSTAQTADNARAALDRAGPGDVVCLRGNDLADADLTLTRSGTPQAPVTVVGDRTAVRSLRVEADHATVQGLATVPGGAGIDLAGSGLVVRGNDVRGAVEDGISCLTCVSSEIVGNTVDGTDGTGILVEGSDLRVRDNTVRGSVRRKADDADGIRFFGDRLTLTGNDISDITHDGYVGDPPHTDCFQTFDNSSPPTVDATITDNTCRNVDDQCLIATAEESGKVGAIGRSHGILFARNRCEVGGSQAVLVQWITDVHILDNVLAGPALDRGAYLGDGSVRGRFFGNTVAPGVRPLQVEDSARAGLATDRPE